MMEEPPKKQNMLESISIKYILQFSIFSRILSQKKNFQYPPSSPLLVCDVKDIFLLLFFPLFSSALGWLIDLRIETYGEKKRDLKEKGGGFLGPLIESVSAGDRQQLHPLLFLRSMSEYERGSHRFPFVGVGNTPS